MLSLGRGNIEHDFELRVVVEKVAVSTQEFSVIQSCLRCHPPESILDLGLRHSEQISLLEKIQNSVLQSNQSSLIET